MTRAPIIPLTPPINRESTTFLARQVVKKRRKGGHPPLTPWQRGTAPLYSLSPLKVAEVRAQ